jgi:hypothetical protein
VHFDTGLMWVDVEDDFSRARRRHVLAQVAGWLRGQPYATRILSLDEVIAVLGWRGERHLGLRTIQLDAVTGTVDSRHDFDRKFRPASSRVRQRWERLDLAQRRGAAIPPIDVYLVGDMYFVKDGHHRVSVAMATRQKAMDAYVTEVHTRVPAAGICLRLDDERHRAALHGAERQQICVPRPWPASLRMPRHRRRTLCGAGTGNRAPSPGSSSPEPAGSSLRAGRSSAAGSSGRCRR